jgi:hypothetical protein
MVQYYIRIPPVNGFVSQWHRWSSFMRERVALEDLDRRRAKFLGWLKRNGGAKHLTTCEKKLRHLGLEVDSTIGLWGQEKITIVLSRGDKVVWLKDIEWADEWAKMHDVEVPHHAQSQYLFTKEELR